MRRHAPAVGALWLSLVLAAPALAQGAPDLRTVKVDVAEVRSGPSTSAQFYVTNQLRRGTVVEIIGERDGGWLEIRPPAGSFSWIKTTFLAHIDPKQANYVVALEGAPVPVYIGSELIIDRRPTVVGARLERGTQVTSVDHKVNRDSEGSWMRIDAPPGEVRFIRAEAVERNPGSPGSLVQASTHGAAPAGAGEPLPHSTAPSAVLPPTPEELWRDAQRAEIAGQTAEAVRLYSQAAAAAVQKNPVLAARALERARFLQGASPGSAPGAVPPPPVVAPPQPGAVPVVPVNLGGPRSAQTSTFTPPGVNRGPAVPGQPVPPGYDSFTGLLVLAGRNYQSTRTYRLESAQGVHLPLTYVIAAPGLDLQPYVGRVIEVRGPGHWDGEWRANVLRAMQVFLRQ
jgi:hypothetical protein